MEEQCGVCGRNYPIPTQWSLVWGMYLCHDCRMKKVDLEIRKTIKAKINEAGEVVLNGTPG